MKSWHVYIVECRDGTLYTGIAKDLERRIAEHNEGTGAKYTRARRPVKLLYKEGHSNRSKATTREAQIKKLSRCDKISLIER